MKNSDWQGTSAFDGPDQSPGFLLWQVSTRWRREIESSLIKLDLTHSQFVLLSSLGWLTRYNENVTQIELSRQSSLDVNVTSQVLRTLEKKGFLERHRVEGNERSKFPRLTSSGIKLLSKAIPLVEKIDQEFFEKLNHKENEIFISLFRKL